MASALAARKQAVFKSVFQAELTHPTPYSTPSARFSGESQPWGVQPATQQIPPPRRHTRQSSSGIAAHAEDQIRWDRAWHTVTSRIQLPPSVAAEDSFGTLAAESQDTDESFYEALGVVLHPEERTPRAKHTEDILLWHTQQVRHHFIQHVLPLLSACATDASHTQVLLGSIHTLEAAHRQYLYGLQLLLRGLNEEDSESAMESFRHDLHAMVGNSMSPGLLAALRAVMHQQVRSCLGVTTGGEKPSEEGMAASRAELVSMADSLSKVGLTGESFQVLFAELMDDAMGEFIMASYAGRWSFGKSKPVDRTLFSDTSGGSYCTSHLSSWVEDHFSRLAVEVLGRLGEGQMPWSDVAKWKEIALGRLAMLRIHELYDIVLSWPRSREGLDDLRVTIMTPQQRLQLTDHFSEALQRRLLHPGCSTLKILRVYISMIRTFHALDHSKVLLDRVVHSLQLYLRLRNDAIRIVVTGLLSDFNKEKEELAKGKLVELARLLNDPSQDRRTNVEDEELDWDDMDWAPVPVDAAVNYKRPKSEDVVGTLIGALGSQDIFIKEFQGIIAERLLSQGPPFVQEMAVLRLLKKRFGENALQNCDVMLKDIGDSRRVDDAIAQWMRSGQSGAGEGPEVHAKVLSRLFWPTLPREHFLVPGPVTEMQERYEGGFEHLKSQRKLTWIDNMGTATVELELEDREVRVECKTYHAAVIYAFGEDDGGPSPARKTATDLEEQLQMDDELVAEALSFWVSQRVLRQDPPGTFTVLETLAPSAAPAEAPAQAAPGPSTPVKKAPRALDAKDVQQRQVYWQFVQGMLTNSAAVMPAAQIGMMLKMLLPDGFPWGEEELREFLGDKVEEGELEFVGGKYKLAKK